ncbi:MAG: hypothetical protein JXB10_08860 [Pirellulales bacterium]|nr:hypothetical protein [Pirellulales bacterium]
MKRLSLTPWRRPFGTTAFLLLVATCGPLFAERPSAAKLLPENTIFFVSAPNARELQEKFFATNIGRMLQDPYLKPLFAQLRGDLAKAVAKAEDHIGISLNEMLKIYQGEIAFAIVDFKLVEITLPDSAHTKIQVPQPVPAVFFEAGDQMPLVRRVLEKIMSDQEKDQRKKHVETINGATVTWFEGVGHDPNSVFFERDKTLVFTTSLDAAKDILAAWDGKKRKTLSDNPGFATVMSRSRGSRDETPQVIFYLDFQNYIRLGSRLNSGQGAIIMAMMPALGLDGLLGVGGSLLLDDSRFDMVLHVHIALENPRSGVLKVIALEPGPDKPEYWVPTDTVKYTTFHWDFQKSFEAIQKLIDSYMGEGTVSRYSKGQFQDEFGLDLQTGLIPDLDGRVTFLSWIQQPVNRVQSKQSLLAVKFKDVKNVQKALERFAEQHSNILSKVSYAGKTYYQGQAKSRHLGFGLFTPTSVGIVDDYLIFAEQPALYEKVLLTAAEGKGSLGDEPDIKLVMSKIRGLGGETGPAMVTFERHDESLRYLYELAQSELAQKGLKREAKRNPFFQSIDSALTSNPLPPFETLQKYLAPGGATIVDDETGLHFMTFVLKRRPE